jgi:hypothetical protein
MPTYFAFNDDYGHYKPKPSNKHLRSHPFYLRATLIVRSDEYIKLSNKINYRKRKFGFPEDREIKWSYPWSLRKHFKNNKPITSKYRYHFLKDIDYHKVIDYVEESLAVLKDLNYASIVVTITEGKEFLNIKPERLQEMHLECAMQRIEMEIGGSTETICVLFLDPESKDLDKGMRNSYFKIRSDGGIMKKYKRIKDSLNFEDSNHSIGIQMADLIAGSFASCLKNRVSDSYGRGDKMFRSHVQPLLRECNGNTFGYGICEVPTNADVRKGLTEAIYAEHCQ